MQKQNMNVRKLLLNCIFIFLSVSTLSAQKGFDLSLAMGFNASQIAGDQLAGFDKLGVNGGLKIAYRLKDKMDINLEMLFSQKGSIAKRRFTPAGGNRLNTTLSYLDFPVYVTESFFLTIRPHKSAEVYVMLQTRIK